jgi:hypothetical protein
LLNKLNKFPVVESISPLLGSRVDHAYYVCRLCTQIQCGVFQWKEELQPYPTRRTQPHIRNLGAMIKHLSDDHHPDQSNHRDKLSIAAFTHVSEIRRLLQQVTDRQEFMLVRSSSEALSTAMWKTNQESSHTMNRMYQHCLDRGLCLSHAKMDTTRGVTAALDLADHSYCICMPRVDTSTARPVTFTKEAKRSFLIVTPTLHRLPPIDRDGPIPPIPPPQQSAIPTKSTCLSLGQEIYDVPATGTSPRMSYALKITGKVSLNQHQTESTNPGRAELDNREPVDFTILTPLPTTIAERPNTRCNGAMNGN